MGGALGKQRHPSGDISTPSAEALAAAFVLAIYYSLALLQAEPRQSAPGPTWQRQHSSRYKVLHLARHTWQGT